VGDILGLKDELILGLNEGEIDGLTDRPGGISVE